MKKNGVVVETKGSKVILLTETGEFALVKASNILPIKGEVYEGNIVSSQNTIKRLAVLAATFLMIFTFGIIDYYNPVKAVELDAKSKILIQANRWNRVVKVKVDDADFKVVVNKIKVNNMILADAVKEIVSEAKNERLIDSYSDINITPVKGKVDIAEVTEDIDKLKKLEIREDTSKQKDEQKNQNDSNNNLNKGNNSIDNTNDNKESKPSTDENKKSTNEVDKSNNINTNDNRKNNSNNKSNNSSQLDKEVKQNNGNSDNKTSKNTNENKTNSNDNKNKEENNKDHFKINGNK
ncbi:anti-sigma factor domain-containing protein [Clostridium folliculivorans]|uniref:RsgI N-terminal anti-sigma domain-containing protein n=1 Tax=Clostridium folliculivorans TaxID=2886038 RepID=A0A9W5Y3Y5_9CLOT|nr:hypothetical protein [Clostridium folliculivorans]GKU26110.1 hypothetical protein CFOLD11_29370 [Clostridium folliculivorans]GKU28196.1 hypothetical protein CFB3_03020 [Clostridium folliculivorans]